MNWHFIYGNTRQLCSAELSPEYFKICLDVLKETNDANIWSCYLKGC